MDRKSFLILVVCAILFMVWMQIVQRLYPPQPTRGTNAPGAGSNSAGTASTGMTSPVASPPEALELKSNVPEELIVLTNEVARYTFSSYGGGLKLVELLKYPESVACNRRAAGSTDRVTRLNGQALQPVLALRGGEALTGDGVFQISRSRRTPPTGATNTPAPTIEVVRAEKTLSNGLSIVKEFELASNYLVSARTRLENRSPQALALPPEYWIVGTATPMNPQDDGTMVGVHWWDGKSENRAGRPYFDNKTLGCMPGTPRTTYQASNSPVVWAAAHNQFFFLALMPEVPGASLTATRFPLPMPSADEIAADSRTLTNQYAYQVSLSYPATNLASGQALQRQFLLFAGPKEYRTLQRINADLRNDLDRVMGYGLPWGLFSVILLSSMNGLHALGLGYGVAIIAITVIIKVLFWPLTAISTRASKRMQALQPQMKALQERYKDDPVKMNRKVMEFMKEHKVSPMAGCWPVLLQLPVLIGFFKMVQSAIELRGAPFLWACDLSKSDTILQLQLLGVHFNINPLPLIMGATMLWQARLMPASPGMDPAQQKIMRYFPMVFLVLLYNYSAGLTLYWTVQNLLSIAQMKLTKAADEKRAAAGTPAARPPTGLPPKKKK